MVRSVEHQVSVGVPPPSEGPPPHPAHVEATSSGPAHSIWALAITGWVSGNEGFRKA